MGTPAKYQTSFIEQRSALHERDGHTSKVPDEFH